MTLKQTLTSSKLFQFLRRRKGVVFVILFIYVYSDVAIALFFINRAVEMLQHFHYFENYAHFSNLKVEALVFVTIYATVKFIMYYSAYLISIKVLSNEERLNQS